MDKSDNNSLIDELSEWKGRALFLEQSVKRLEQENRELRHELGRTKNQVMQWQTNCEEACRQRDREVNRKRTIQQFEEEERRAHAITSAALADPVPLTADEHGRATLASRISQLPMRRVIVSVASHQQHRLTGATATPAAAPPMAASYWSVAAGHLQQQQQQGHTFPTAMSVFGEHMSITPRRRQFHQNFRRFGPVTSSSNTSGVRIAPSSSVSNSSPLKRPLPYN